MKKHLKTYFNKLRKVFFITVNDLKTVVIVTDGSKTDTDKVVEIKRRFKFFDPTIIVEENKGLSILNHLNDKFVGFLHSKKPDLLKKIKYEKIFHLNYSNNADDGWEYHRILSAMQKAEVDNNRIKAIDKLNSIKEELSSIFNKTYIFGTGPSLEKAYDRTWDDGIRIVSNTIVKDKDLWNHINPHFIVAGDAIYHFGISDFAQAFRKDLADRLAETNTYFVFQEHFYPFVKQCFPDYTNRLIPIPVKDTSSFYNIIETKFELPAVGNVLNNLLLPSGIF
jgi:hypothetical protein